MPSSPALPRGSHNRNELNGCYTIAVYLENSAFPSCRSAPGQAPTVPEAAKQWLQSPPLVTGALVFRLESFSRFPPRPCENALAEGRITAAVAGSEERGAEGQLGIAAISGRIPMIAIARLML